MNQLHVISSGRQPLSQFIETAASMHPFVDAFHLREQQLSARELYVGVQQLHRAGVPKHKIVINDRADVAWATGAGGVHLGYRSLPLEAMRTYPLRIGCSVHSIMEAKQCEQEGADYVFYGHVYLSASKPNQEPTGLEVFGLLAKAVTVPVIAIGGIRPEHVESLLQAGASGIAVISGILDAADPYEMAQRYAEQLHRN